MSYSDKPSGKCRRCTVNDADQRWVGDGGTMAAIRGGAVEWCERCCVEVMLDHARDRAAAIPWLESKLVALGGPVRARDVAG